MRKAIGIVRVSQVKGREGDSFVSPDEQRERIEAACERDGLKLLQVLDELDVSGGKPLKQRPGLSRAVDAVEHGDADVIVAAYFDRLVRSVEVQAELVRRVEKAGGDVIALDHGSLTNGGATRKLSATMLGAVAEYHRDITAEKSREAQQRAINRGVPPWPRVTPGYRKRSDGRYEPVKARARAVSDAFELRASGATIAAVRMFLQAHDVEMSHSGVTDLMRSRAVLGEIHFGNHEPNLNAHEPIVDRDVWQAVQRVRLPRGRQTKSERLLARLGVLVCGSCGARMVAGGQGRKNPYYRCHDVDCTQHMVIAAELAEQVVWDAVKQATKNVKGRASIERNARAAESALEAAQTSLDAAIARYAAVGLEDEPAAQTALQGLREARDSARERVERLGGQRKTVVVTAADDRLSFEARRALIRATIDRAIVEPGRGADRVTVQFVTE
jgi:DNA invertase Pin-like site-specific DNA recombinase